MAPHRCGQRRRGAASRSRCRLAGQALMMPGRRTGRRANVANQARTHKIGMRTARSGPKSSSAARQRPAQGLRRAFAQDCRVLSISGGEAP
eukprot:5554999-Pyramimonas_sp.AAC.1